MRPRFIVSEKSGIETVIPGFQGEWLNHCDTEASRNSWVRRNTVVTAIFFKTHVFASMNLSFINT